MNKAAFIDLDKTLYDGYLILDWALDLKKQGVISFNLHEVLGGADILAKLLVHKYAEAMRGLEEITSSVLEGKQVDRITKASQVFLQKVESKYYPYAREITVFLQKSGYRIVFVTAEPDFLAELVKSSFHADDALGIDLDINNGIFQNDFKPLPEKAFNKGEVITEYARANNLSLENSIAIGDSEGDISMLKIAGTGILLEPNGYLKLRISGTKIIGCPRAQILQKLQNLQKDLNKG